MWYNFVDHNAVKYIVNHKCNRFICLVLKSQGLELADIIKLFPYIKQYELCQTFIQVSQLKNIFRWIYELIFN